MNMNIKGILWRIHFWILFHPFLWKLIHFFLMQVLNNMNVAWADGLIDAEFADFRANLQPAVPLPEPPIPDIPLLEQPLLNDAARREALYERLVQAFVVEVQIPLDKAVNLVYKQAEIERYLEAALISDEIPRESFLRNLNGLRSVLFSPQGTPLSTGTLDRYLREIARNGTRQSIPYRRVYGAIRNYDLFLDLPQAFRNRN